MKTLPIPGQIGGSHYGDKLQPWDLQICMTSSGDLFIDARRTDALEYVFRMKGDLQFLRQDLLKAIHNLQAAVARIDQLEPQPEEACVMDMEAAPLSYQDRVWQWMVELWPPEVREDKLERCFRFFEESAELVQSLGMTYGQAVDLVTYVWFRPMGEPMQEVGGVMTTLNALGCVHNLDIQLAAEQELERVNRPEIKAKIRAKHFSKPAGLVSALPGTNPLELVRKVKAAIAMDAAKGGTIIPGPPVIVGERGPFSSRRIDITITNYCASCDALGVESQMVDGVCRECYKRAEGHYPEESPYSPDNLTRKEKPDWVE